MHAKYRFCVSAFVFLCILFAAPGAQAVVINAADYAVGTNLTNAFPGVTLGFVSYNGYGSEFTPLPLVISTDAYFSIGGPTLFKTLGGSTDDGGYPPFQIPSNGLEWDAIYIAFAVPVYSVTAVGFNEDDDPSSIIAYAGGQEIIGSDGGHSLPYQCIPSPDPDNACLEFHEDTVSSTTPISYILVGGESETTYYTELDIPGIASVPEPPSLPIFGSGLLAVIIVALRRRKGARLLAPITRTRAAG